jgi:hypothetical protein
MAEAGTSYSDNLIVAVDTDVFVAIVDGAVVNTIYTSATDAEAAFDTTANTVSAGAQSGKIIPVTVTPK